MCMDVDKKGNECIDFASARETLNSMSKSMRRGGKVRRYTIYRLFRVVWAACGSSLIVSEMLNGPQAAPLKTPKYTAPPKITKLIDQHHR